MKPYIRIIKAPKYVSSSPVQFTQMDPLPESRAIGIGIYPEHIENINTSNKLMEKLNGIHQDVEVHFITHEGAYLKFPKLALKHANAYMKSLAMAAETAENYRNVKNLLECLKKDGNLVSIWESIKIGIKEELWNEFKAAYKNNVAHPDFLSLIDNGEYLNAPDFSSIENSLLESPGYQAFHCEQAERNRFWSSHHPSNEAEDTFEECCDFKIS